METSKGRKRLHKVSRGGFMGDILRLYWGHNGIMEKKMKTTIMGYIGYRTWGIRGSYYSPIA